MQLIDKYFNTLNSNFHDSFYVEKIEVNIYSIYSLMQLIFTVMQ